MNVAQGCAMLSAYSKWNKAMNRLILVLGVLVVLVMSVGLYMNNQAKQRMSEQALTQQSRSDAAEQAKKAEQLFLQQNMPQETREYVERAEQEKAEQQSKAEQASREVLEKSEQIKKLRLEWDDTNRVAGSTSRIALSNPVQALQRIRRDLDAMQLEGCLKESQGSLSSAMEMVIEGYIGFMADKDLGEYYAQMQFEKAKPLFADYDRRIAACQ